jgi:hypothetical protein
MRFCVHCHYLVQPEQLRGLWNLVLVSCLADRASAGEIIETHLFSQVKGGLISLITKLSTSPEVVLAMTILSRRTLIGRRQRPLALSQLFLGAWRVSLRAYPHVLKDF